MEGLVYLCSWKRIGKKFRVWLIKKPELAATQPTFEAADEELAGKILEAYGDGENVREYKPPQPDSAETPVRLVDLRIVQINGNSHVPIAGDPNDLYSEGVCRKCRSFLGSRTQEPLKLQYTVSAYDGGFVWQKPFRFFSEDFLKVLKPSERSSFDWQPVVSEKTVGRKVKVYYEFRPRLLIPFVAVKGLKFDVLCCPTCKTIRTLHSFARGTPIYHYISAADLPKPLPSCFAVGLPTSFSLCFRQDRWQKLAGKPGTKGLVSNPIGVVEERFCIRNPKPRMVHDW